VRASCRGVGSEANFDESRDQAFRPPGGGEFGERHDQRDYKRHDKFRDLRGRCRRTCPKLLWRPDAILRVQRAGPYVGATLGYEWGSIENNPARPNGVAGGFEAGFNWQNGNFIYGGEADISFSAANDTFARWQFSNPGSAQRVDAPASPSIICCSSVPPASLMAN